MGKMYSQPPSGGRSATRWPHGLATNTFCRLGRPLATLAAVKPPPELTDTFRRRGLKVTPQRQAVFAALHHNPHHPTAEAVHATVSAVMPTISLRTVYQTLNDLVDMGEIAQVDLGIGPTRFDPCTEPHQHLVCTVCHAVADLHADTPPPAVPESTGFVVAATEITHRGVCASCRSVTGGRAT